MFDVINKASHTGEKRLLMEKAKKFAPVKDLWKCFKRYIQIRKHPGVNLMYGWPNTMNLLDYY